MNDTNKTNWTSYNQQRRELNRRADIQRHQKHIFYCHLIIAACAGASVVLGLVLIHQIFFA